MNRNRTAVGAFVVALCTAGFALGPASAASAGEAKSRVGADWETQSIVFTAAAGHTNDLNVFFMYTSDGIQRIGFRDVVPLQPGDHCAYSSAEDTTAVVCELPTDAPVPTGSTSTSATATTRSPPSPPGSAPSAAARATTNCTPTRHAPCWAATGTTWSWGPPCYTAATAWTTSWETTRTSGCGVARATT